MNSKWQDLYQAAIFEPDRSKVSLRIEAAARAIKQEQTRDDITPAEDDKLHRAMRMLAVLGTCAMGAAETTMMGKAA
jgi:hypothetical protein